MLPVTVLSRIWRFPLLKIAPPRVSYVGLYAGPACPLPFSNSSPSILNSPVWVTSRIRLAPPASMCNSSRLGPYEAYIPTAAVTGGSSLPVVSLIVAPESEESKRTTNC